MSSAGPGAPLGMPPTAHASVGEAAQTPQSVAGTEDACSTNWTPSQWVIRPFSPTIHTSLGPEPPTHQYVSGPPGFKRCHRAPSKWTTRVSNPLLPSGPPTAYTSLGLLPHAEST